jgi:HEAT repeat protein
MGNSRWAQLIQDLYSEDVDRAVRACEEISETADVTNISELYSLLEDDSFFIREAAAFPLARLEGVRALPALFRAFTRGIQDGHDNDGMNAAIGELLDENQQAALPFLENMLLDEEKDVRANGAWALGFVAEHISPAILLNLLENESDLDVRLAAIGSLSSFEGYPEVVEKLIRLLDDANEQVLIGAISSLGYLGDKRAIAPVKEVLHKTANKRVREFVQFAIKQLNS